MKRFLRFILVFASFFILTTGIAVSAQSETPPQNNASDNKTTASKSPLTEVMPHLEWSTITQSIDSKLKADDKTLQNIISQIKSSQTPLSQSTLQTLITQVRAVKDETSNIVTQLQTYSSAVNAVLEILGPKPESSGEDSSIAHQRTEAQKASQLTKTLNVKARFYDLQAQNLLNELGTLRHKLQHDTLSHRSTSPLSLTYWRNLLEELPLTPFSFTHNSPLKQACLLLGSTILILFIAASGGLFLRRRLINALTRWLDHELMDNMVAHRLVHCLSGAILAGLAFLLWIGWSTIFEADINKIEQTIGQTLPVCAFILGAGLPLKFIIDGKSNNKACLLLTLAILCDALVKSLKLQDVPAPAIITSLETILSLVTLGCCFAFIPPSAQNDTSAPQPPSSSTETSSKTDDKPSVFFNGSLRFLRSIALIYMLLNIGWILTGYSTLAFMVNVSLVSLFYALSITGCFVGAWQAFVTLIFSPYALPGQHLLRLGITHRRLEFFNVLISALGSLLFILLFTALLTNEGDFTFSGIINRLHHVFAGSTFHGVAISPETFTGCLLLVIGAHYLIKGIRFWLTRKFFPTTTLTMGLRTSILSILTYCGWIIVGLVLLSLVGLSVQNLTWVVSALSVGVGFGLQSIVKDFISGLILLAERPIEAGDTIEVSGNRGEVKRVNVRTTDIRLSDGSTLIVPNSQFITSNVKNASFGNVPAKLTLSFTLPVNSDLEQVRTLIMQAIEQQKNIILPYPAPGITLSALNDLTLNMVLAVYVAGPEQTGGVKNKLISDIFNLFQKERIILTMS